MRPTVNAVKVELDKERMLRFDFNAMARFEGATGMNAFTMDWKNLNATQTLALLWASLIHEDPALTLDQVGAMVDAGNVKAISKKLIEAITASSPKGKEAESGEKK